LNNNLKDIKIALIGKSGSGKTKIAKYLQSKYEFIICNTGKRVRELAEEFFNTQSKNILHKIDDNFNSIEKGIWLRIALSSINSSATRIVIDSLRFIEDYNLAKKNGYIIWKINCQTETRIQRLTSRGQTFTHEDNNHSSETELDNSNCDFIIENGNIDIQTLYLLIDEQFE
jgi:dephospho-CoA kinase